VNIRTWSRSVGVAMFLLAACAERGGSGGLFTCSDPAPLNGTAVGISPKYLVQYHDGVDAKGETQRLAGLYGFEPHDVYEATRGFSADLDPTQLQGVRCASSVEAVYYNRVNVLF